MFPLLAGSTEAVKTNPIFVELVPSGSSELPVPIKPIPPLPYDLYTYNSYRELVLTRTNIARAVPRSREGNHPLVAVHPLSTCSYTAATEHDRHRRQFATKRIILNYQASIDTFLREVVQLLSDLVPRGSLATASVFVLCLQRQCSREISI